MTKKVKTPQITGEGICHICQRSTFIIDRHHIWPQSLGGANGPVVDLCSACHSGIHRQSVNLLSKKAKRNAYFPAAQMERAKPLIQWLVVAIQQGSEKREEGSKSKVVIEVDSRFLSILHLLKLDAGHTNLSAFCGAVLHAYAKYKL
jgi:hypothetical protein